MYVRVRAIERTEIGGVEVPAGGIGPLISAHNLEVLEGVGAGRIEVISPHAEAVCAEGVTIYYCGKPGTIVNEHGCFYRMIPQTVPAPVAEELLWDPDFAEFSYIGRCGAFIPHNTTITDFSLIKEKLPADPRILFMRDEGAGDLLLSLPTVKQISREFVNPEIHYATRTGLMSILDGVSYINCIHDVATVDLTENAPYDLIVNWCRAVEYYRIPRNRLHRVDAFAAHLGIELYDRRIDWKLAAPEFKMQNDKYNIGFVMTAASPCRTWHIWRIMELVKLFAVEFPEARLVLIHENPVPFIQGENVLNMTGQTLSFAEAAALLSVCDAVITPDTGLAHAAGALGIPMVVLTGSMPADVRFRYYDAAIVLTADNPPPCAPCWDYQKGHFDNKASAQFNLYERCKIEGPDCMAIEPAAIVETMREVLSV